MSAQAGIFYFDGRPIEPGLTSSIGGMLDAYGPDGGGAFVRPGLVMVQRALHVTPEDARERQPLQSARGNVMTWDGRLDNREDLLAQLWHDVKDDTTDVALALAAYERWGVGGFARLVGDWSLVVWDAERQAIVMASDYMGVRPLHYHACPDRVTWSTTLECAVRLDDLHDTLEPKFFVGLLANRLPAGLTPYRGLLSVPTASTVTFTRSTQAEPERTRFWSLRPPGIRYDDDADYAVHLRTVFLDAIRSRLRSARPVWAQLSGGWDSSSIVCAADVLLSQGLAVSPALETISYVTDGNLETDERRFIRAVEQQRGRESHYFRYDNALDRLDNERFWITPTQPPPPSLAAFDLVRRKGGRLLLTGIGGDSIMGNVVEYNLDVAESLRHARGWTAAMQARGRAMAAKGTVWEVLASAARQLRSPELLARRVIERVVSHRGAALPPAGNAAATHMFLLNREMADWWFEYRARELADAYAFPVLSQRLAGSDAIIMAETRHGQTPSDEPLALTSHPLLDRRLVEYMLAIPVTVVAPPGRPRGLMREAFGPFMPARIVDRIGKGSAAARRVRDGEDAVAAWTERPDANALSRLGILDSSHFREYLEAVRPLATPPGLFFRLFDLEQWLTLRDGHIHRTKSEPSATVA